MNLISVDPRRDLMVPGDKEKTIEFCANHFAELANQCIAKQGGFTVALSGGSTPKAVFQQLLNRKIPWNKVTLFWSDERAVPLDHTDSNYRMAMDTAFSHLPIPKKQIFPMNPIPDIEEQASKYEELILTHTMGVFDLVMLGMGEDGHTASLFPKTHALHSNGRLVVANFIPKLETWRMTLTFKCINQAKNIAVYVIGENKAAMLNQVLQRDCDADLIPAFNIGTEKSRALWIADRSAIGKMG